MHTIDNTEINSNMTSTLTETASQLILCPICCEEKNDVTPIPHWNPNGQPLGDIGDHKMCGDCTRSYDRSECPFCRALTMKDDLLATIQHFIENIKSQSNHHDHNELADLFTQWQTLEMIYGTSNPRIIHQVASLVMQDASFSELIRIGVANRAGWLRDAAGIFFRFHSLGQEERTEMSDEDKDLLERCYDTIFFVIRRRTEQCGHFHGALYNQALAAYFCASGNGLNTSHTAQIVREVGDLIVEVYENTREEHPAMKWEVPERIWDVYMSGGTANVWGGEQNDPVFRSFYQRDE